MKSLRNTNRDFSSDSFSQDPEDFSSSSAQNVFQLQKEILVQSQSIEDYIRNHQSKLKTNESFSVLESLFSLFKSEVSMNLSLRKAVMQERRLRAKYEQESANVVNFYNELGRITNSQIANFEDVFNYVISLSNKFIKLKKKLQSSISENQMNVEKLEQAAMLHEEEVQNAEQIQVNADDTISALKTKLTANKTQISSLKSELKQANEIIQKQRMAIQEQKNVCSSEQESSQQQIDEIKEQCDQEIQQYQKKIHLQRQKHHDQNSRIKELENQLHQQDEVFQNKQFEAQNKISELTEEIQRLTDEYSNTHTKVQSESKKIEYLKNQNVELEAQVTNLKQSIEKYETQLFTAKTHIDNMKASIQENKKKCDMKIHSIKLEHRAELSSMTSNVESNLKHKMKEICCELKQKDEEILEAKQNLETAQQQLAELVGKVRRQEKRRQDNLQETEDLKIENERLRNIMREKTDSQKEVEYVLTEFKRIQDMLDLGPQATPTDIVDAISSLVTKKRRHRY